MDVLTVVFLFLCVLATAHLNILRQGNVKEDLEDYIAKKKLEINPRYRQHYHITPPVGWMNDPNGFSYFKGEYHMFYQFYPYDSVWGPRYWGHVTSPNLVDWKQQPTALLAEEEMCFSGSAVVDGDFLVLLYTARITTITEPFYNETQYLAFSDDGIEFTKYEGNPVITFTPNNSPDFRDPKVWKHGDHWYVIIGSSTEDERGRVLLYRSLDLMSWEFLTVLGESNGDMGYMWECPDFFEINGKFVFLFSPQGLNPEGDRYKNIYQTGYYIGDFNYETFEFVSDLVFQELDYGHDFYATQTNEFNGKRYVVAWLGMWDVPHPEDVDGWACTLTILRELKLVGNRILMKPVDDIIQLRQDQVLIGSFQIKQVIQLEKTGEIIINGDLEQKIELSITGKDGGDEVLLKWDPDIRKVVVDRLGDIRQVEWTPIGSHSWRIFLDASSLELFCGEGEVVFSSRVYPNGDWRITNLSSQTLQAEAYKLRRSVPE